MGVVLPALKRANIADYTLNSDELASVVEFLGVTGTLVEQAYRLLLELKPSREEHVVLHSVEVASFAPLTRTQHIEQLVRRGFSEQEVKLGLDLSIAAGLNKRIRSSELNEDVIFNPYVWEAGTLDVATFMAKLPSNERDVLLGIVQKAAQTPGLALPRFTEASPGVLGAARKVGLLQAATVKSTSRGIQEQTYVFAPMSDAEDDRLDTTESLHLRKLFVAHILFGHQKAGLEGGRIMDPIVLTSALLGRGRIGPATNIGTDYHLLETHGIVRVEESAGGRAYLHLVKDEIVRGGLGWLRSTMPSGGAGEPDLKLLRSPSMFTNPEAERARLSDDPAALEVAHAVVLRLREEAKSATRQDRPFDHR